MTENISGLTTHDIITDKIERLKSYMENEKKYHKHYSVPDGSTEASYYEDTWLYEFNKLLKEEEE